MRNDHNNGMGDLLIHNANVVTLDQHRPHATALLVRGGRIAVIGDWQDVEPDAGGIPTLDLQGQTVVPGFIDSHVHFTWTGVRPFAADLRSARTPDEVLALVASQVTISAPGALILGQGLNLPPAYAEPTSTTSLPIIRCCFRVILAIQRLPTV